MSQDLLRLENISKIYGQNYALSGVNFSLKAGEVHALMGENGAGKSTLMKILAGNEFKDGGDIFIEEQKVQINSPSDAKKYGIAIIHQELNTIPTMTVAENLALGEEPCKNFLYLDRKKMYQQALDKLALINAKLDPNTLIGQLSIGMQQMVEIARAVSEKAKILILDEPTAALSKAETLALFKIINRMKGQGVGLIYISHRMEEVWNLADRITVFRDGTYVGTNTLGQVSTNDIVKMMVGRQINNLYEHETRHPSTVALEVNNLSSNDVGPVSFTVKSGEVVAMSGLVGSGRTETGRLLFGADSRLSGTVLLYGKKSNPKNPRDAILHGIGMLPEDRKSQGLFLEHEVYKNIDISSLTHFSLYGVIRRHLLKKAVLKEMNQLNLRENSFYLPVKALSGGNQQKAALARWLLTNSKFLILDEPTRGVDIGAKREIYELINKLAKSGKAILVISSDLPEAIGISDRLLVMREGKIVKEFKSQGVTQEQVMMYATGSAKD